MNNIKALKRVALQLNYVMNRRQKIASVGVFVCMLVGAALELLGVSAIYPFLQTMLEMDSIQDQWYGQILHRIAPQAGARTILIVIGVGVMLVFVLKNIFMVYSAYVQNAFAAKLEREIAVKLMNAYLKRPYEFFLNTNSSVILRGVTQDVTGVYNILLCVFTILAESLTVTVLGVFLLFQDWAIAIGAMALATGSMLLMTLGMKGKMKRAGKEQRKASALKYQYGNQAVNGIKEITVLDRKERFAGQFERAALLEQRALTVYGFLHACPDRILEGVCIAGFMGIVCIRVAVSESLEDFVPVLGAFAMGAFRILPSFSKIADRLNTMVFHQDSLQEVTDNLRAVERDDWGWENAETPADREELSFHKELSVDHVDWRYLHAKENVLKDVSLTISKGESVAFVGASGAGKTTLADIIMGLLKPQSGTVRLDGVDIFGCPHQWSKVIGYVPQSVFLIDDTVRANVAFGLTREEILDDKVWEALRQAQLEEFVKGLPDGLDTIVGERGVKFSGGQRQRIAIARALYEDPDILVLDEATSALDTETETAVMESIDMLRGSKTLIIVAHRLSTIRNCDRIYEIVDGAAVERDKQEVLNGD